MTDSTGQSAPDHEGTDLPILIKEMHAEINKQVDRLRIDHEKRWEQTLEQLKDLVRMERIL